MLLVTVAGSQIIGPTDPDTNGAGGSIIPTNPVIAPPSAQGGAGSEWTSLEIQDGNGSVLGLSACDSSVFMQEGLGGIDMPPIEYDSYVPAGWHGSVVTGVRANDRIIDLPVMVADTEWAEFDAAHKRLIDLFNPLRTLTPKPLQLVFTRPDGTRRYMNVHYKTGAQSSGLYYVHGVHWRKWPLQFVAFDPFVYAMETATIEWKMSQTAGFFDGLRSGGFPIIVNLSAAHAIGASVVQLPGEAAETFGVWEIHGPADGLATLRNDTTGREWVLELSGKYKLAAGESVKVVTDPRFWSVTGPDGSSWWGARVGAPALWSLQPGTNNLSISVAGADTTTVVSFTYRPTFLTS